MIGDASPALLDWIAETVGARAAHRGERIQSLWGGYGELFRVRLEGGATDSVVVKWARPPTSARNSVSDARKRRSYAVETAFYHHVAPRCDDACRVPRLFGSRAAPASAAEDDEWILVLEDLDAAGFTARQRRPDGKSLEACLAWLAAFHARFVGEAAQDLWPIGTYWHLATRTGELAVIEDPALREAAPQIDAMLQSARFRTLVHGDAKEANFCFTRDGRSVAAVDFQYVGGGCAMQDLAYLLHGRDDERTHELDDSTAGPHVETYFRHLHTALTSRFERVDELAIEAEWRRLYPIAKLDFCRFLAGWAPDHWRGDTRGQRFVAHALRDGTRS